MISIEPLSLPFDAGLTMPGSKSHANRAIIAACLAKGTTEIKNATPCDDVALLVKNLQRMGFSLQWKDRKNGTLIIKGGIPHNTNNNSVRLFCDNAGTTLRFLTSLACIVPGKWTITGNNRMRQRPINDLTSALKEFGANIEDTNGFPSIRIVGGSLKGGSITLDASKSSQFLTSLLLIGPFLTNGLSIKLKSTLASPTYVDITRKVLSDFGTHVEKRGKSFHVPHSTLHSNTNYQIEGDWSAAGAFLVLSELSESRIQFTNLSENSMQGDRLLKDFIIILRGAGKRSINCLNIPDQVMNLVILAAHRKGVTCISGARNLRLKETDRLKVLTSELKKTGIEISETEDGLIVKGGTYKKGAILNAHDDHRLAMCFAVLGLLHSGIQIKDPDCVSKSYPKFFHDLNTLHLSPRCIAIIGMRGVGKSTVGKAMAKKMKLRHIDTDEIFVRSNGPIQEFVQKKGWSSFRKEEEDIVVENLLPSTIVSLGGGAIESNRVRKMLKTRAIVVFLVSSIPLIIKRLEKDGRPPLTNHSLNEEVKIIMKKRKPLYLSVSDIIIDDLSCVNKVASHVITAIRKKCLS